MRKNQQQKILGMIPLLGEAQSAGLYADAQDGAEALAEFVEQIAGKGTRTAALLGDHCRLLYDTHQGKVTEKALRKHLAKITACIRGELRPDRIEVVFVCYKAAMSDSVLTIYEAARNDPNCEVVWLPVPYFDKNTDGMPKVMHYDGPEHYPGIECADWQSYDIEAHHPDVIFTYNPYDNGNYVTSIHPLFYNERLCKLTDMLVYVPYFVTKDDKIEEDFVTVAGCVYADKVIVQSEPIRKSYISHFKKEFGSGFGRAEDKFVALGSPKFDAVAGVTRADFHVPDEWRELIGERKTVLYNTTIAAILQHGEKYLDKICYVHEVFKARDDVALWWRPHPLSESTYESMRPGLAERYRAIVAEYRAAGFGIYDDSSDLDRAIVCTDAYYGDWSSLISLYAATGKPILHSNPLWEIPYAHEPGLLNLLGEDEDSYFVSTVKKAL